MWVLLPFVLHACHFWQLLTVKDFEDVTAAKCFSLAARRRLFCCQHDALPYWLLGINLGVCVCEWVCVCVWRWSNFTSWVSHSSPPPPSLLLRAVLLKRFCGFKKMLLLVSEKENEIISQFLYYNCRRKEFFFLYSQVLNPCWMNSEKTMGTTQELMFQGRANEAWYSSMWSHTHMPATCW